jgi:2-polyprenyl-6-methoxyphenol hydroxylase-like FAD-dependent oxidoreductase
VLDGMEVHSLRSGRLQRGEMVGIGSTAGLHGVAIHRAKLHDVLLSAIGRDAVRLGRRVASVDDEGDGAVLRFEDGPEETASVVIAADGVWSGIRTGLFPRHRPMPAGQIAWRGVVELAGGIPDPGVGREIWGREGRIGWAPIGGGLIYWFAVMDSALAAANREPRPAMLRHLASAFPAPVPALLEQTPDERIIETELFDLPSLPAWHRGPVVLLGDAAHATTPNLGQGGAQAIEDGFVLARELAERASAAEAFRAYEAVRRRKAEWIVRRSRAFGRIAHLRSPLAIAARDVVLRLLPQSAARRQIAYVYDPRL